MAGHSKWHNIRLRKGAQDAKRGKQFTKVAREIIVAAKFGGSDPDANPRLRMAIREARSINMPNDNIERAIKKGSGELGPGEVYEEATFEGYGPHGVALLISTLTDNRQRTVPEIRSILGKRGGNLGEGGCVSWMFERKGVINVDQANATEEDLFEAALDAGADDVIDEADTWRVTCPPEAYEDVLKALETAGIGVASSEITMLPTTSVKLGEKEAPGVLRLLDDLEDNDDVQKVYANFDIPDEVLEGISG